MRAVLLDFNGTMFFDSSLHVEAWSKIYQDLHPEDTKPFDMACIFGANNDAILQNRHMVEKFSAGTNTQVSNFASMEAVLVGMICFFVKTKPIAMHKKSISIGLRIA